MNLETGLTALVIIIVILGVTAILMLPTTAPNAGFPPTQQISSEAGSPTPASGIIPDTYQIQTWLAAKGYYKGKIDGVIGKQTLTAWHRCMGDQDYEQSLKCRADAGEY